MKINDILDELIQIAKNNGIEVRKDNGNFKSGYCTINEQEVIILNKTQPVKNLAFMMANSIPTEVLSKTFIKPVIREFIDEQNSMFNNPDIELTIKN